MKKTIIIPLILILTSFLVFAASLKECQRTILTKEVPCIVATSYLPSQACENYNITITNNQNETIENLTYYSTLSSCQFIFTHNTKNIYFWNSSIESGVITVEQEDNMMAIIIVFIALIAYFAILGVLNKSTQLKFLSFSLSIIELIIMVAVIYIAEGGGDYLVMLRINFYSILIIGFGLGMLTFFAKSGELITEEEIIPLSVNNNKWSDSNKKW